MKCRGKDCDREIIWGTDERAGKKMIPLEEIPATHHFVIDGDLPEHVNGFTGKLLLVKNVRTLFINHYRTCPNAGEFKQRG